MLIELHIENFAIIDNIDLKLGSGLITFTGETGAGKSILIDAVETLLGGRADNSMIRSEAERAYVEGVFQIANPAGNPVLAVLEREDLSDDPSQITVAREIKSNGRSIARINGRSVSVGLLREIGEYLIDVHGQSEHLSLLHVRNHLGLLDSYASVSELLADYQALYKKLQAVRKELSELRTSERDAARRVDTLSYQINEIESANLRTGEEESLREERNRLGNAEGLTSLVQEALQALDEGSAEIPAVTDLVGKMVHALNGLARLDPAQTAFIEQAQSISDNLTELSLELRNYLEGIEFNPRRLDQVEERLELIHNLKRKYGDSVNAVLAYALKARQEMEIISHASERIQELETAETDLLQLLGQAGLALSQMRQQQALKLAAAVETELEGLHMSGTSFMVAFERKPDLNGLPLPDGQRVAFDANGLERVEFLIAPNPGEGFKPLVKIASGGETSRLMLALKNVLASADRIPTLIFDEIDQGIGGLVGGIVGRKLRLLANRHQVLCVTHLPQLAAYGTQHYHVEKQVETGRTLTRVRLLAGEERIYELAQMLGGASNGTLQSAREILQTVAQLSLED